MFAKFDADRTKILGQVRERRFRTFCNVAKKKSRRKWAWLMSDDAQQSPEHRDIRFLNIRCTVWKLLAKQFKKTVMLIIAPPTGELVKRL